MDTVMDVLRSDGFQTVIMYVVVAVFVFFGGQIKSAMVANIHAAKDKVVAEVNERVSATTATQLMLIVDAVERYAYEVVKVYTGKEKLALALQWAQDKGLKITQADIEIALTAVKKWNAQNAPTKVACAEAETKNV